MRLIPCTGERFMVAGGGRFLLSQVQDAAQLLREGYAQQVQLIYLDPPFGTGTSFYAKVPGGQAPVQAPAYTDRMEQAAYLSMMEETLGLCYDLLAPTGAVYVHIDHRMSAYIRLLMDKIFGAGNFVNEIIWAYRSGGRATRYFSRKHDNILFYRKSRQMYFNIQAVGTPRGPGRRNHMKRTVDEQGRIAYTIRSGGREYIYREDALMYPGDVWEDIGHLHQRDPERTGYSTQKPQALLERIIKSFQPTWGPGHGFVLRQRDHGGSSLCPGPALGGGGCVAGGHAGAAQTAAQGHGAGGSVYPTGCPAAGIP